MYSLQFLEVPFMVRVKYVGKYVEYTYLGENTHVILPSLCFLSYRPWTHHLTFFQFPFLHLNRLGYYIIKSGIFKFKNKHQKGINNLH